jgi:hypothetical protein
MRRSTELAKLTLPGRAFNSAITSATVRAFFAGAATSTFGAWIGIVM